MKQFLKAKINEELKKALKELIENPEKAKEIVMFIMNPDIKAKIIKQELKKKLVKDPIKRALYEKQK